MSVAELLGVALGSGAFGAGIMKIFDRLIAHRLERKDKKADCEQANIEQIQKDVSDNKGRLQALEDDRERRKRIDQATLKALNALLVHEITGNSTGAMEKEQKDLAKVLIEIG